MCLRLVCKAVEAIKHLIAVILALMNVWYWIFRHPLLKHIKFPYFFPIQLKSYVLAENMMKWAGGKFHTTSTALNKVYDSLKIVPFLWTTRHITMHICDFLKWLTCIITCSLKWGPKICTIITPESVPTSLQIIFNASHLLDYDLLEFIPQLSLLPLWPHPTHAHSQHWR